MKGEGGNRWGNGGPTGRPGLRWEGTAPLPEGPGLLGGEVQLRQAHLCEARDRLPRGRKDLRALSQVSRGDRSQEGGCFDGRAPKGFDDKRDEGLGRIFDDRVAAPFGRDVLRRSVAIIGRAVIPLVSYGGSGASEADVNPCA